MRGAAADGDDTNSSRSVRTAQGTCYLNGTSICTGSSSPTPRREGNSVRGLVNI